MRSKNVIARETVAVKKTDEDERLYHAFLVISLISLAVLTVFAGLAID